MTNNKISASRTGIPNPVDIYVGERLKKRRKLLGLTQTELADMLGLSFQQIVKYEKATNRISASRLVDLSNVLEVSISYFFNNMPTSILKQSPRLITNSKKIDIKELEAKAEKGDENAHYHLGLHYFNTRDIWTPKSYQKNIEQALNHFKKANGKYNSKYYIKLIEKG